MLGTSVMKELKALVALWASGLGVISSMRLDVRKDVQSGKSTWSVLQSEVKAHLRVLERRGMIKVVKRTRTHAQFRAPFYGFGAKFLRFCLRDRENAKFKIFKIKYI